MKTFEEVVCPNILPGACSLTTFYCATSLKSTSPPVMLKVDKQPSHNTLGYHTDPNISIIGIHTAHGLDISSELVNLKLCVIFPLSLVFSQKHFYHKLCNLWQEESPFDFFFNFWFSWKHNLTCLWHKFLQFLILFLVLLLQNFWMFIK